MYYTPELSLKTGIHTNIKPNINDKKNIKKAINTLKILNNYHFSQGVVVDKSKIIAIEGKGGTEKMLIKCKKKNNTTTMTRKRKGRKNN